MPPADANPPEQGLSEDSNGAELLDPQAALTARAKEIARRITERVRKAAQDTGIELHLPESPSGEHRALG